MALKDFAFKKFEERCTKKSEEVEKEYGPFEDNPGPFSDYYEWRNPGEFRNEALKSVLSVATDEKEAEIALDHIFNRLTVTENPLSGY